MEKNRVRGIVPIAATSAVAVLLLALPALAQTNAALNSSQSVYSYQGEVALAASPASAQLSDNTTVSPGATYDNSVPSAPNTGQSATASLLSSIPLSGWIAIGLIVLAIIILIAVLAGSSGRRTERVERRYQRY
jgi:Trk-type K+ transport system membrane component